MFSQDGSIKSGWPNSIEMADSFKRYFENIHIFDIYEGDVIERVLCKILQSPIACASYRESGSGTSELKNSAVAIDYDLIATTASTLNYFDLSFKRHRVAAAVKSFVENELKKDLKDLPQLCPSAQLLGAVYNQSLSIEKIIFPERKNHSALERQFEKTVAGKKMCIVDAASFLNESSWELFFRSLNATKMT
jgi:hypothetical protein